MGYHIKDLTCEQVAELVTERTVVVLPIGGGSKEHGGHLPMGTDLYVTDWVAELVTERCDVVTLPTLPYGYFPAFTGWKGSVSVEFDHFRAYVKDILFSFIRHGVKKFLIIDGGVSTHPPLCQAARELMEAHGVTVAVTNILQLQAEAEERVCRQRRGGHGDESETSAMLVIRPDLVRMDRTGEEYFSVFPGTERNGRRIVTVPGRADSPRGSNGTSALATEEKGRVILSAMVDGICGFLDTFIPWQPEENA